MTVAVATPIIAAGIKKGLLKGFTIFKLNTTASVLVVGGTFTVGSVTGVAVYNTLSDKTKTEQNSPVNQNKKSLTAPVTVYTETTESFNKDKMSTDNNIENGIISSNTNKVEQIKQNEKTENQSIKKEGSTKIEKTQMLSSTNGSTDNNTLPVQNQATVHSNAITDTSQSIRPTRKVVYVKPQPVVIKDTVVKVIKKVRKKE